MEHWYHNLPAHPCLLGMAVSLGTLNLAGYPLGQCLSCYIPQTQGLHWGCLSGGQQDTVLPEQVPCGLWHCLLGCLCQP